MCITTTFFLHFSKAILRMEAFLEFKIDSFEPLQGLKRSPCPKCQASRMYFCYNCYEYVANIEKSKLPVVKLPIPLDIIKHPKELDGKSTAIHSKLIARDDVQIFTYPTIPDYSKDKDVLLVFPGETAHPLLYYSRNKSDKSVTGEKRPHTEDNNDFKPGEENGDCKPPPNKEIRLALRIDNFENDDLLKGKKQHIVEKLQPSFNQEPTFKKIVLIDSTWNQVHQISNDERLKGMRRVELTEQTTKFWRKQNSLPDTYLATIEAIHLFYRQYHQLFIGTYTGQYDNLLFFFKYFYNMVNENKAKKQKIFKNLKHNT